MFGVIWTWDFLLYRRETARGATRRKAKEMEKSNTTDTLVAQKTPGQAHLSFTMAALTTIGGLTGFLRAKSLGSVRPRSQRIVLIFLTYVDFVKNESAIVSSSIAFRQFSYSILSLAFRWQPCWLGIYSGSLLHYGGGGYAWILDKCIVISFCGGDNDRQNIEGIKTCHGCFPCCRCNRNVLRKENIRLASRSKIPFLIHATILITFTGPPLNSMLPLEKVAFSSSPEHTSWTVLSNYISPLLKSLSLRHC